MKDKNVDAEFHHKMMTKNILPAIRKHFGKNTKFDVHCQQDGAGGHGTKGHWSYLIEQDAENKEPHVMFHTQPANSPILNLCDLGLWPMIEKHVILMRPKNVNDLWKAIQEGFWKIDQAKLENMCHSKTVACVQIAKEKGGSVTNPHHTGYSTAKRRLGGKVPTWIQMRTMAREDKRWIYEYEIPAKGSAHDA